MKYDCLLIGFNDVDINVLYQQLKSMGLHQPAFLDLDINVIEYENNIYRVMDIINEFRYDKKSSDFRPFHNSDLLCNSILYLGSFLAKNKLTFDYINLFHYEKEKLKEKLLTNDYQFIAITTTLYTMVEPIIKIMDFVKEYNSNSMIAIGGPFISKQASNIDTVNRENMFELIGADIYIMTREGEGALAAAIQTYKKCGDLNTVKNIAYKTTSGYKITELDEEYNPLNENPIDYTLFNKEDFGGSINVRISKGCPYNCAFCGFPKNLHKFKYLSVKEVISDLDNIEKLGCINNLFFIDDSVNVPKKHFEELLRAIAKRKYNFKWNCFLRCDQCDEETVKLLAAANCEGVFLGLESTDENVLKNMNKTSKQKHFEATIPIFKKYNITVFISLLTGFPGETFETYKNTIDFLEKQAPEFYRPQLWYCDPITPIWSRKDEFNLSGSNFSWSHNTLTSVEACGLNEWSFLYLDDPVWTPDPGFNFISIYYMKIRGFSIEDIKVLLKCFNAVAKQKLLHIKSNYIPETLYENLKYACNQEINRIDYKILDKYAGETYKKAEAYVCKEFDIKEDLKYCYLKLKHYKHTEYNMYTENIDLKGGDIYRKVLTFFAYAYGVIFQKDSINILSSLEETGLLPIKLNHIRNYESVNSQIIDKTLYKKELEDFGLHVFTHNTLYEAGALDFDFVLTNEGSLHKFEVYKKENFNLFFDIDLSQSKTLVINVSYKSEVSYEKLIHYLGDNLSSVINNVSIEDLNQTLDKIALDTESFPMIDIGDKEFQFN